MIVANRYDRTNDEPEGGRKMSEMKQNFHNHGITIELAIKIPSPICPSFLPGEDEKILCLLPRHFVDNLTTLFRVLKGHTFEINLLPSFFMQTLLAGDLLLFVI